MVEAEEVYKLIQNKHTEWETGQLPSVPPRPASAGARGGRPQSAPRARPGSAARARGSIDGKKAVALQAVERQIAEWRIKWGALQLLAPGSEVEMLSRKLLMKKSMGSNEGMSVGRADDNWGEEVRCG